ncbi:MAG TPA: DUF4215 domain-containing protein [Kofleriaceae bacterium]|jgi:cysteine-rich repeat protein
MASKKQTLSVFCLGALAAAIAACASPGATPCEQTGIICPPTTHCAAAQAICIDDVQKCGNLVMDPGEACDDGNNIDGDGCSHDCMSKEVCGNHVIDRAVGEVCDDGNTADGDGCSHDCKSLETCGNGIVDTAKGEVCDDGNQVDGDGCSANCKSDERCGNGIVDTTVGEVCDPPGHGTCQPGCRSSGECGNGKVDPGEECDDGLDTNRPKFNGDDRDCRMDCVINRCGDGFVNSNGAHHEDCDDHDRVDNNACTNDCKVAMCGDGILGPNEECDDENTTDGDGCTHDCKKEFCGDSIKNNLNASKPEQCDSGGVSTDLCNFDCTTPRCGDGIVNDQFKPNGTDPEQCDPPSVANGCSASCRFEHCGNGVKDPGEECDGTDGVTGGQVCSLNCHIEQCGNGILDPGEQCDDGNHSDTDDCISSSAAPSSCKLSTCGDGHINARTEDCDDGLLNGTLGSNCSTTCHTVTCGNGVKEQGEECDDGNASDADDCLSSGTTPAKTCKIAKCGDGVIDTTRIVGSLQREDCDDGALNGTHGDRCSASCRIATCGNGVIDQDENCDDGFGNNGAGKRCNGTCHLNLCGDGDKSPGEQCDVGTLDAGGNPTPRDGVLPDGVTFCDADCTFAVCGDTHINHDAGEDCDDGAMNGTGLTNCDAFCKFMSCGNGTVDPAHGSTVAEQCDPGGGSSPADTETCNFNCTIARCGDSYTNGAAHETCDQGVLNGTPCDYGHPDCTRCNATCTDDTFQPGGPFCGDSRITMNIETCDDGLRNGGKCTYGDIACLSTPMSTVCNANCDGKVPNTPVPNGEFCGDNVVQTQFNEQCDPGGGVAPVDSATCNSNCTFSRCGDGHLNTNPGANETCDDGNASSCGSCSADCGTVTLAKAIGSITAAPSDGTNISVGDTFTLDDGVHTPTVFTFIFSGNPGPLEIKVSDGHPDADDAPTVAAKIKTAIENAITSQIATLNMSVAIGGASDDKVILTNTRRTSLGNTGAILHIGMLNFQFENMDHGQGGDCANNIGCTINDDCATQFCDTATKRCAPKPP